jgi:hypothetical protein
MRAQVRRELAAGDAAAALGLLRVLVSHSPEDASLHETTARVAEWAGEPQTALEHWLWLLTRGHTPSAQGSGPVIAE